MSNITKITKTKAFNKRAEKEMTSDMFGRPNAMNIEWLVAEDREAIALHIGNLIATYGKQRVLEIVVEQTANKTKRTA